MQIEWIVNSHYRNLRNHFRAAHKIRTISPVEAYSKPYPPVIPLPLPARRNRNLSHVSGWNLLSPRVGGRRGILFRRYSLFFSRIARKKERERVRGRGIGTRLRRRSLCGPGISYTRIMPLPGSRQHHETVTRETGPASNAYERAFVGVGSVLASSWSWPFCRFPHR